MKNQKQAASNAESSSSLNLADLEKIVAKEPEAFFNACNAMRAIIDNQLYKSSHRSLKVYLKTRFAMSRSRGYQLADCARVMEHLSTKVDKPMLPRNERQVRQLVKLPMDEQYFRWMDIRSGRKAQKQSAPELDRYEKLTDWLVTKYQSWPAGEELKFIETVEGLMGDMRRELRDIAAENKKLRNELNAGQPA